MNGPYSHLVQRTTLSKNSPPLHLSGMTSDQWCFIWSQFIAEQSNTRWPIQIFLTQDANRAQRAYDILRFYFKENVHFYPGLDISPYSKAYVSESAWLSRIETLAGIVIQPEQKTIIVTTLEAALLFMPPSQWISSQAVLLKVDDIVSPTDLAKQLSQLGYTHSSISDLPGTFSKKGDIFDIYPVYGGPIRLNFFDDLIEKIFPINPDTQRTIADRPLEKITIPPGPQQFTQTIYANQLREHLPQPETKYKNKYDERSRIFNHLNDGQLFENYPLFSHLFFPKGMCLLEHATTSPVGVNIHFLDQMMSESDWGIDWDQFHREFNNEEDSISSSSIVPHPTQMFFSLESSMKEVGPWIFLNHHEIESSLDNKSLSVVQVPIKPIEAIIPSLPMIRANRTSFFSSFFNELGQLQKDKKTCFVFRSDNAQNEITHLLDQHINAGHRNDNFTLIRGFLNEGFYHESEDILYISDADLFSVKQRKTKTKETNRQNPDLFAEQMATLKEGDFIIHQQFGIGKYLGLETITAGGKTSDFLVISYKDGDRVYVPVYKLNQIQKHSESDSETRIADLKSHKFDKVKARAKESAKKLAFDLLRLQAERKARSAFQFSPPDHLYHEFELAFPFEETPDQVAAIEDTLSDMQRSVAMDRLVCGDVGFGKTEVAMRAAFKAVEDKKQVVILVPTTILALQHFHSFKKRFEKFPVTIDFLSRFRSNQESKQIVQNLKDGAIDIIIGTHKLLADDIAYKDLGLLIIDEEQRFGVGHKEKLKLLKTNVDVLTLSATPIPRTLQLAFLGIRDLSLIRTAPPRRQSIKTFIIKEDPATLSEAINREIGRGGQVFYVHNRVQDIESIAAKVKDLAPSSKILIAHGQMSEKDLETKMTQFYSGEYNVLISTTIIESGLDIPNANTMIVNRANTFGLSQLHQLRGRIGRSDRKAFAYFVIPDEKKLTEIAERRLKALQTYAEMGSGFNIASSDLEIRGAGDILGGEQSGHIEEIGLELYLDLLQEAIEEIKGEAKTIKTDLEIQIPEPAYIPTTYISEAGLRLKYYKKLSNAHSAVDLDSLNEEIIELFGHPPAEFKSFVSVLNARLILSGIGLKSLKVTQEKIYLQFDQNLLDKNEILKSSVINTFVARPKVYKITPGYGVIYTHKSVVTLEQLLEFSKTIAGQISPC